MSKHLDVYFDTIKAGTLSQETDGALNFRYSQSYLVDTKSRAISYSMPLSDNAYKDNIVRPFFSGLLPDEGARQRLAGALGISSGNSFGLLEIIGGECAGALSLLDVGNSPSIEESNGIEFLNDERLIEIIGKLRERPLLGGEEGVRLSLAGAQDKLAVCVRGEEIGLAKGGLPTTHILKPVIQSLEGTVENELFCLKLAARLGLPVARAQMQTRANVSFLLVERYDRKLSSDGVITRLHQEDFCQALSIPPELKYEDEGGPGTERCIDLISAASHSPALDRLNFIRMLIFHYLVGNADAHGKNYALLYKNKTPELAPLYDVVCTAVYPKLAKQLAMRIGGRNIADTIHLKHWHGLAANTRGAQRLLESDMAKLSSKILQQADALLTEFDDLGIRHEILLRIRSVIETRSTFMSHILS